MFTGLVETAAKVASLEARGEASRLCLEACLQIAPLSVGESLACNGVCLTVSALTDDRICFDVLEQTLSVTNLGTLRPGDFVNLERSLQANGRFGGHFVTGHVDGVAQILTWEKRGADWLLEVELAHQYRALVVPKGCIAIDGISLTIADVLPERMRFWIIPHTRAVTNLIQRQVGDLVNVEFDLLGKYVAAQVAGRAQSSVWSGVSGEQS